MRNERTYNINYVPDGFENVIYRDSVFSSSNYETIHQAWVLVLSELLKDKERYQEAIDEIYNEATLSNQTVGLVKDIIAKNVADYSHWPLFGDGKAYASEFILRMKNFGFETKWK